ncbi:Ig-like domain-containing protein [Pelomonas sp. V22]|uniref:Ig-like domain-containing protein n=1 Tax=Pelomonas sp. V22 TaxID=2822139 RepID=UPI0024A964AD|nr:Ig-like domain-containing protein [Pelomonas sp. V22]MDI4634268.1 Ig-like domain-containing protein [Pelomonas sp. V22]
MSSIVFQPITFDVAPGGQLFMRANAKMSDGNSYEITHMGSWTSSAPAVAAVGGSTGLVQGISVGQADITVTYLGVRAVAHIRVGTYLQSLEMSSSQGIGLGIGATLQFAATGHYTDASKDATEAVEWSSSNPAVLAASNASGSKGFVKALAPGEVKLTSSSGSVSASVNVEVLAIQSLAEYSQADPCVPGLGGLTIDAAARALTTWGCTFATAGKPDLFWATTASTSTGWSEVAPIRTVSQFTIGQTPTTAGNASGMAVAAWSKLEGIYAALYKPGTGWQEPQLINPPSPASPNERLSVGIDAQGNAMVFWHGTVLKSSSYSAASGRWTTPVNVPVVDPTLCTITSPQFYMNAAGQATLVWLSFNCYDAPGVEKKQGVYALRWLPGMGWLTPELVASNPDNTIMSSGLAGAMNEAGSIAVAWIDDPRGLDSNGNPKPMPKQIFSRHFTLGDGWGARRTVATDLQRGPNITKLGMNARGDAVLSWANSFDFSVSAALFDAAKGWGSPIDLMAPVDLGLFGDATPLTPFLLDDGRALVPWKSPFLGLGQFALSRYTPGSGWVFERQVYVGRRGTLINGINIQFNRKGQGAIAWVEGTSSSMGNVYVKSGLSF